MDTHPTKAINTRLVAALILAVAPLSGIALDMYTPSLPSIATFFHVSATISKLTITFFIIGYTIGQFICGGLTDSFGRKKLLLIGLAIFSLSSLAIAFTHSITFLSFMRLLQGISAAFPSVIAKAMSADVFEGEALAKISAYYSAIWAFSPVAGPVAGSYLEHYFGWHTNFYVYACVGFIIFLAALFLPETCKEYHRFTPLTIINNYKRVLFHKGMLAGGVSIGLGFGLLIVFSIVGPFIIINSLHYHIIFYGHMAFLVGLMTLLGSLGTRYMLKWVHSSQITRFSMRNIMFVSTVFLVLSFIYPMNLYLFLIPILVLLLSEASYYPSYMKTCLSFFPNHKGTASAVTGICIGSVSFLASLIASIIPTTTLIPTAIMYYILSLTIVCIYLKTMRSLIR